jgi:predicted regulator of Ras-like GTPase activity (Roadblock/LC7/MglB family)
MNVLQPLRDLPEVEGSFVMDAKGAVVVSDLRALFRQDMIASAARRLQSMLTVVDDNFDHVEEMAARFDRHQLVIRRSPTHVLVAVTKDRVPATTMRMAMNLVLRELERESEIPIPQAPPSAPQPMMQHGVTPPPPIRPPPTSAPRMIPGPVPTPRLAPRSSPPAARPSSPPAAAAPKKKGGGIWGD